MSAHFEKYGVHFQYPQSWQIEQSETEVGWTVNVQSPGTSFLLIAGDDSMPDTENVLNSAIESMRSDYADLEAQESADIISGQRATGYNVEFTCLDLPVTCCLRSLYSKNATLLILWQSADLDLDETEPMFRAILASLTFCDW